jgi:hypothetical protein
MVQFKFRSRSRPAHSTPYADVTRRLAGRAADPAAELAYDAARCADCRVRGAQVIATTFAVDPGLAVEEVWRTGTHILLFYLIVDVMRTLKPRAVIEPGLRSSCWRAGASRRIRRGLVQLTPPAVGPRLPLARQLRAESLSAH